MHVLVPVCVACAALLHMAAVQMALAALRVRGVCTHLCQCVLPMLPQVVAAEIALALGVHVRVHACMSSVRVGRAGYRRGKQGLL